MDTYFTKEADIMINIVLIFATLLTLERISLEYLHLTVTFTKLACLNVKLLLAMSL